MIYEIGIKTNGRLWYKLCVGLIAEETNDIIKLEALRER